MTAKIIPIDRYLQSKKAIFYTVHVATREKNEFSDFSHRMLAKLPGESELGEMLTLIEEMAKKWGAKLRFFKSEPCNCRFVFALQIPRKGGFDLCLYCLRLSSQIVIILNGDIKSPGSPRDCPLCKCYFESAIRLAIAIDKGIRERHIEFKQFEINIENDFELIF